MASLFEDVKMEKWRVTQLAGEVFEWRKWAMEIPAIQFKSEWRVRVVPPFAGAVIRFTVSLPRKERTVSVYLDCYDHLGIYGDPYWEIYPDASDTNARFAMKDTKSLLRAIEKSLSVGKKKNKRV